MPAQTRCLYPALLMLVTLFAELVGVDTALAGPPEMDKVTASWMTRIKQRIGYKGDKTTTWYVIELVEMTSTGTTVRSTVQLKKIQGQEEAAQAIFDFLSQPSFGIKNFIFRTFPDTEKGKQQMAVYIANLLVSGAIKGYRPAN